MQVLYQFDVQGDDFRDNVAMFTLEASEDDLTRKMASEWAIGTWNNIEVCDKLITEAAIKWDMSRLSSVDKSILRLAAYQMRFCDDIPKKVVINEAIEIAKCFSGSQSPRFINGVLDAILRKLKSKED